jgi:polysaccharide export outer membrane protein
VIAMAGSLTATAGNVIIVRRDKEEVARLAIDDLREGRIAPSLSLQDGDTVYVPPADRFYVTGFVKNPGQYVLVPNMTVDQAIAVAGGLAERGTQSGIKIIRRVDDKPVDVDAGLDDLVQPNDTIRVRQRIQ